MTVSISIPCCDSDDIDHYASERTMASNNSTSLMNSKESNEPQLMSNTSSASISANPTTFSCSMEALKPNATSATFASSSQTEATNEEKKKNLLRQSQSETSSPVSIHNSPAVEEATHKLGTMTVTEALSKESSKPQPQVPQSTQVTRAKEAKNLEEIKQIVSGISASKDPLTPPPTPSLSAYAVKKALKSAEFLSPDCPKLVFGCTDEAKVTHRKLITVCMHGDEVCGMLAINELIKEDYFTQIFTSEEFATTRLTVLLGNPKGVLANKRYIDINLNRVFHVHRITKKGTCETPMDGLDHYELERIQPIATEIAQCDEYVDIHSTSAKSFPFALPAMDSESEEFATTFDVEFVIEKLVKSVTGTTIGWAHHLNKKAVCVECGKHDEPETVDVARRVITRFVSGVVERRARQVLTCSNNEVVQKGFHYIQERGPPKAFEKVNYNDLLAADDEVGEIRCQFNQGAYIIMPTANPILGEEAWFWGELKE